MIADKDHRDDANTIAKVDLKLEAVVIPVSDVGRSKKFSEKTRVEARRRLLFR